MERKLSDKERFIIQVAVNRSAENHFDRQKGWKRVKRCTNNGYIIRRLLVGYLCIGAMSPFGKRLFIYPSLRCLSPGNFPLTGDLQSRRHTCIDLRKRRANLLKSEPIPSYQATDSSQSSTRQYCPLHPIFTD